MTVKRSEANLLTDSKGTGKTGNAVFRAIALLAGITILATLALVAVFLLLQAKDAILAQGKVFTTMGSASHVNIWQFTMPQVFGTLLGSGMAMLMAVPVAIGIALFISHYAPKKLAQTLGYLVDLLAAIPSVIYGLWGALWLVPKLVPLNKWLNAHFGWFPLFGGVASPTGRTISSAAVILAVMILPIVTSISREIFLKTPGLHEEAALALGATRWEMIRLAVLPHGRSGIVSASMLGLGRALGETMAVLMVLSVGASYSFHILEAGKHSTIAANIALQQAESTGLALSGLFATGLALFFITMIVNMLARWILARTGTK
ncbi:phosphate ABC transporter permease subunit PstC [Winkia sp. UMB6473-AN360BR]|uniref:phosphate ABC transporter permease subunit PstC n=1 Tax=Winkia sp. UMB6473-AN360BR TaxID=3050611 RepID=UPI0025570DAD|nr:phosphate ABC transporter permease subunit PstC [Winkia sp. UMB6473-AN360BR]MDK8816254.1 phosphate ABC transporter permease subunit PstC [Winkia sp. UMB6473-AN360BR]